MNRLVGSALAGTVLAVVAAGQAGAADVPAIVDPAPAVVPLLPGPWYVRPYFGVSNQEVDKLDNVLFRNGIVDFTEPAEFDAAPFFGVGVGYRFTNWLRADMTGEYRAKSDLSAFDRYDFNGGGWDGTNDYGGGKEEWLLLANAYLDLGTWRGITPYVGAGIGASHNTIRDFTDVNAVTGTVAVADSHSQWQFAWALHAGVGIELTPALSIDVGYRYVDLGDARTGDIVDVAGINAVYNPMIFDSLTSHDVYLGVRYAF